MEEEHRFFTRDEVVVHNTSEDFWVIVNKVVYDLTDLFKKEVLMDEVSKACC
jgi:cytochrome b involved in lipid metabolism